MNKHTKALQAIVDDEENVLFLNICKALSEDPKTVNMLWTGMVARESLIQLELDERRHFADLLSMLDPETMMDVFSAVLAVETLNAISTTSSS